jgi:hypothetical protein
MMENITKERLLIFIKSQKIPLALGGVIIVILLTTFLIPSGNKKPSGIANTNGRNVQPTKKPFNPFGFLSDKKKDESNVPTQDAVSASLKNIHSGNPQAPIPTGIIKTTQSGSSTTQKISGNTIQTTQGSLNPQSNIQTGVDSNTEVDSIRIIFRNPDGTTTTYIPPGTPPNEVRWGRYTNTKTNYAINYPSNWRLKYSIDNDGNEGITLHPPYVDANDPKSPFIGFGMSDKFLLPAVSDSTKVLITNIRVDGVSGDLYTEGSLGRSYIASIFNYKNKYFGLGASISDATFAYVYYYMLYSLTFNTQ